MFAKKFLLLISGAYSKFYRFISIILCLSLFWNAVVFPVIITGTMIKTSQGLVPIEALVVGNRVLGLEKESIVEAEIINIKEEEKQPVVRIKIAKEALLVGQDHLFYDSSIDDWVKAKNLTNQSLLVDCDKNKHQCLGVESLDQEAKAYEVSLEEPHTFFIHKSQILVHNEAVFFAGMPAGTGVPSGVPASGWFGVGLLVISGVFSWLKGSGKLVKIKDAAMDALVVGKKIAGPFVRLVKWIGGNKIANLKLKAATVCALAAACINNGKANGGGKANGSKANAGPANGSAAKSGSSSTQSNNCQPVKHCKKCKKNQKRKNRDAKKQKKDKTKNNVGANTGTPDPNGNKDGKKKRNSNNNKDVKKERIVNTGTKTEFLHKGLGRNYRHDHGDYYRLKPGCKPLCKNGEYIRWDGMHRDVEVFDKNDNHLGSFDIISGTMYKDGKPDRGGAR